MLPPDANRPAPLPRPSRPVTQAAIGDGPLVAPAPLPLPPPEGAAAAAPGLNAAPTVSGLVAALRRRLLLAFAVACGGMALAVAAVCLLMPARYVVQSQIKLSSRPSLPMFIPLDADDPTTWKQNQEGILKSPRVLLDAMKRSADKGLSPSYSVDGLAKAMKVDFLLGPEIMHITLAGDDAETAAGLLNDILDAYLEQVRQDELGRRAALGKEMGNIQREYGDKLRKADDALRAEEKREGYDPEAAKIRLQAALASRQAAMNNLLTLRADLGKKERELKSWQASEKNLPTAPVPLSLVKQYLKDNLLVQSQWKAIEIIDLEIADIRTKVPEIRQANALRGPFADKKKALRELDKLIENLRPAAEDQIRKETHEKLQSDIAGRQVELVELKAHEEASVSNLKTLDAEIKRHEPGNLPRSALMDKLRNDVAQTNDALSNLNKQINKLKVEPVAASRAVVLQRAEKPTGRDHSRQIKLGGAAGLGMFGMLLFGVALWEFRTRKVNSAEEVSQGLGMNLLGTLPALPPRLRRPVPGNATARDLQLQNQMTEAVDALRTMLLHHAKGGRLQVVMVTSAGGGEGKTSLASQLAASLARAWRKTLLVDGDLRNPAAHKLFDVPLEPGLSEVLRGEVPVGDAVRPTPLSRLWMVPAGHWDSHAVQALAQDGVGSTFAQMKSLYEFIVVDSCPVLPVADALLLAQHVDGVIFSVLRDVSRLPAVHAAQQRLGALGVRTLGAVVIGAGTDAPAMAYQYPQQTAG